MPAILLLATLAALASGPLWYLLARRRPALLSFLDGFVLVSISGLVLLEVLPEAFGEGGAWSLGFVALGLFGPTALEHGLARARRGAHLLALGLAIVGLVLHSLGDGAALIAEAAHTHGALGLAIAIHSVPVGLVVWWLLYPVFGAWLPALALVAMGMGTVIGYLFGVTVAGLLGAQGWAWFQALIAGSILHVIFGRPHLDEDAAHHHSLPPFEGLGNFAALLVLLAFSHTHGAPLSPLAGNALRLALDLAPFAVLAYALVCLRSWRGWQCARAPFGTALRVALVDAVDRSAAWALGGLVLAALLLTLSGVSLAVDAPASLWRWLFLGVIAVLFAGSLLRRGGRAWLAALFGR
jgi:hypothetical protein